MPRPRRPYALLGLTLTVVTAAAAAAVTTAIAAGPATRPAGTRPTTAPAWPAEEPVFVYRRDALPFGNFPARPEFVAWPDGTVMVRFAGRPYRGRLLPAEVAALVANAREAGLFAPPIIGPVAVPDGPSYTLIVRDGDRRTAVTYGGVFDDAGALGRIDPKANPSPDKAAAFMRMWHRSLAPVHTVAPDRLDRADAEPPLPDRPR